MTPHRTPAPTSAADALRAECDALRAENARLRAVIDGRDVAPTNAECGAHGDAGGAWLVSFIIGPSRVVDSVGVARKLARDNRVGRWLPLDADDRPCPWPVVPAEGARS